MNGWLSGSLRYPGAMFGKNAPVNSKNWFSPWQGTAAV
jgi:hypothetical protein